MIKAIIFDLGGVLQGLDWSPVVNSLLDVKEDLDIFKFQDALYYDRTNYFDLYATNRMSKERFWRMVAGKIDIELKYIDRLSHNLELLYSFINYDLLELIKSLKDKYKLFVLSNACPEIENKVIKDNLYVHLFEKLYFSHNIGTKKPDKEAYLVIARENCLSPEECLIIDNDVVNIKGAREVGMAGILYKGVENLKNEFSEILELKGLLGEGMIKGYTSGVFDLFHQGHLNLLRNAKKLCDRLIVGVTSDELSISFKGKKPIVPFEERMDIVESVKYVDLVVPQKTMDKIDAWREYKFDILFASRNPTEKWCEVESAFLRHFKKSEAPKIVYLPYTPRVSSSLRLKMLRSEM